MRLLQEWNILDHCWRLLFIQLLFVPSGDISGLFRIVILLHMQQRLDNDVYGSHFQLLLRV